MGASARYSVQKCEWKVEVGDTQTYTITKCFDDLDMDEDGNKHNLKANVTDDEGNLVEVTLKRGSTLEVEIIALENEMSNQTITKLTFDGKIAEEISDYSFFYNMSPFVIKTVDNKSYWEAHAETYNISVEGELLVKTEEETIRFISLTTIEMTFKWNWETGWLTYWSFKMYTEEKTDFEFELSIGICPYTDTTTSTKNTSGWNVLWVLLGLSIIISLRRWKKKIH